MSTSKHSVGTGSCLCGDIRWEVSGALREMSHCHCLMCRKAHGTAFVTYALSTPEDFRWLSGEQSIRHFASSTSFTRPFCGRCGSTVADSWDSSGEVVLPIGSLEGDFKERPLYHIFVASAAPWHEISDDLPRYAGVEPGNDGPELFEPEEIRREEGDVCGSCLCSGVAYAIDGELMGLVNCHCSRCRRARSAVHAGNGFTALANFRWRRGEDLLRDYPVPGANGFGQTFCGTCSSPMPRANREHDRVVVPAGSLDVDPVAREAVHIYCGSKATWFDITDELPRFDEAAG